MKLDLKSGSWAGGRGVGGMAGARLVAGVALVLLAVVVFVRFPSNTAPSDSAPSVVPPEKAGELSEATRALLRRLRAPVEIRLYSIWREGEAAPELRVFAERVSRLLEHYQSEGQGMIIVNRVDSRSVSGAAEAAMADGLDPLRNDRGEAGFVAAALVSGGQKVILPRLVQEWEEAVEFDLSRAIARVAREGGAVGGGMIVNPTPVSAEATEALRREIPDVSSMSEEEAAQRLRDAALEEFKLAVGEMQAELREAREGLAAAQKHSEAEAQIARERLRTLQVEQNERLAEVSRRMQSKLAALEQMNRLPE